MAASYDSMSIQTYLHGKMSSPLLPIILLIITGAAHGFAPPSAATVSRLYSSSVSAIFSDSSGIVTTSTSTSRLLSTTSPTGSDADTLLDALTQTVDAATRAASTSNELAQSLSSSIHHSTSFSAHDIMTPEAITTAQSNLETLHQNLLTSTDPHVLTNSLHEALQTSITAADHALQSTSVLSYNLAHFDSVLASCIHSAHPFANLMTPEMAEIAQSKLSLLLHNLSGGNVDMDDKFITNFVSYVDTMLDGVTTEGRGGDSNVVLLGAVAVVIAYSQREVGVTNYKKELRRRLESGELNLNELMKDIEVHSYKRAGEEGEVSTTPTLIAEAEDQPADIMPSTPLTKREVEVREVEALLTTSKKKKENEAADSELVVAMAVATPPVEDIPMDSLLKQAEEVAINTMSSVVKRVTVKNATKPKKIKTEPAASPLARLLAQELNLKLVDIGKGTGKNGKILIDDVRKFQAKVEEAKKSISASGGAYFASVSA